MADEAILRIVMQDAGGGNVQTGAAAPAPTPPPQPSYQQTTPPVRPTSTAQPSVVPVTSTAPTSVPTTTTTPTAKKPIPSQTPPTTPPSAPTQQTAPNPTAGMPQHLEAIHQVFSQSLNDLDAAADALKALGFAAKDIAAVRQQVEATLTSPKQQTAQPVTPFDIAKKRVEAEDLRAKVDEEYTKLRPPPPPPPAESFLDIAKKRVKAEEDRAAIDAEYAKLKPPKPEPPFDPKAEAKKRYDAEQRKAQVDAEYKNQYGDGDGGGKSSLDAVLDVAKQFRGTIGGFAGVLVGSTLDAVAAFRKAQVEIQKTKQPTPPTNSIPQIGPPGVPPAASAPSIPSNGVGAATDVAGVETGAAVGAESAGVGAAEAGAGGMMAGAGAAAGASAAVPVIGAVVAATAALVVAFKALEGEIDKAAGKYGEYNPEIAQAQAIVEINSVMGDIRRSREAGPELAKYIQEQGKLQQQWEEIKIQLLEDIVPAVTGILEVLNGVSSFLSADIIEGILLSVLMPELAPLIGIWTAVKEIKKAVEGDKKDDVRDPVDILFGEQPNAS